MILLLVLAVGVLQQALALKFMYNNHGTVRKRWYCALEEDAVKNPLIEFLLQKIFSEGSQPICS